MSEPKISICIPVYQKPEYVIRAIQSIAKQDHKNVEIILSDDLSWPGVNKGLNYDTCTEINRTC